MCCHLVLTAQVVGADAEHLSALADPATSPTYVSGPFVYGFNVRGDSAYQWSWNGPGTTPGGPASFTADREWTDEPSGRTGAAGSANPRIPTPGYLDPDFWPCGV